MKIKAIFCGLLLAAQSLVGQIYVSSSSVVTDFGSLTDVTGVSPSTGQAWGWDGSNWTNLTVTASSTNAAGGVLVYNPDGTAVAYAPSADTDAARGTALSNAIAAASSGDTIIIGPGTYDGGSLTTGLSITNKNLSIVGSGRNRTVWEFASDTSAIEVQDNSAISFDSLTITNSGAGVGIRNEEIVYIQDSVISGDGESLLLPTVSHSTGAEAYAWNSDFIAQWDNVSVFATNGIFVAYNCYIETQDPSIASALNGVAVSKPGASAKMFGGEIYMSGSAAGDVAAVNIFAGTVSLYGTKITHDGGASGNNYDFNVSGGTANAHGVSFSGQGNTGTVTYGDLTSGNLAAITSMTLPNGTGPTTDAAGEIAFDTDAWTRGAPQVFDGTANTYLVGTLASDAPNDGEVPKWNTGGTITWEADNNSGGSSSSNLSNINLTNTFTLLARSTVKTITTNAADGGVIVAADGSYQHLTLGANTNITWNFNSVTNQSITLEVHGGGSDYTVSSMGGTITVAANSKKVIYAELASASGATNISWPVFDIVSLGNAVGENVAATNAPTINTPTFLTQAALSGSGQNYSLKVAPTNNVNVTNINGVTHMAAAATLIIDGNNHSRIVTVTNRISAATTIRFTNTTEGMEFDITVIGEASGGTDRTVTLIPHVANDANFVADLDNFGTALAANKAITLTNGNAVEISWLIGDMLGTNVAKAVTRQFSF